MIGADAVSVGHVADAASVGTNGKAAHIIGQRQRLFSSFFYWSKSLAFRRGLLRREQIWSPEIASPFGHFFSAFHIGSPERERIWTREIDASVRQTEHEKHGSREDHSGRPPDKSVRVERQHTALTKEDDDEHHSWRQYSFSNAKQSVRYGDPALSQDHSQPVDVRLRHLCRHQICFTNPFPRRSLSASLFEPDSRA